MAKGKICAIKGCMKVLNATTGRICQMHRSRFHRHGDYDISPNWPNLRKGQPCVTQLGYVRINVGGKRILQHRHIMEQYLGRKLNQNERVHHLNDIKTDNHIDNLRLCKNNAEHMSKYHSEEWKKRKTAGPYSTEDIAEIIKRINRTSSPKSPCFCNGVFEAKNLCNRHYQWAYKHKFI